MLTNDTMKNKELDCFEKYNEKIWKLFDSPMAVSKNLPNIERNLWGI